MLSPNDAESSGLEDCDLDLVINDSFLDLQLWLSEMKCSLVLFGIAFTG